MGRDWLGGSRGKRGLTAVKWTKRKGKDGGRKRRRKGKRTCKAEGLIKDTREELDYRHRRRGEGAGVHKDRVWAERGEQKGRRAVKKAGNCGKGGAEGVKRAEVGKR